MKMNGFLRPKYVHRFDSCQVNKGSFSLGPKLKFVALFVLLCFSGSVSLAIPNDVEKYNIIDGGFSDIQDGAYIEGSASKGGLQPDYVIDLNEEPLKSVLKEAQGIGRSQLQFWDKVDTIVKLVGDDFFKYNNYSNPYYLRLLKKYREAHQEVPLNEYLVCQAGVCREHALVLHFALKAAGIQNFHVYAQIYRASRFHDYEITEDHAFNVIKYRGTDWVVDAYYWGFNGFRLKDLMAPAGITEKSKTAPIAVPAPGTRRIIKINSFPKVYNPKMSPLLCSQIFN